MSGRAWLPAAERARIGAAILELRAAGVCWKRIEAAFGRGRVQLHRYACAAGMIQQSRGMIHPGAGAEREAP